MNSANFWVGVLKEVNLIQGVGDLREVKLTLEKVLALVMIKSGI